MEEPTTSGRDQFPRRRASQRHRHAEALSRLMEQRRDLRGVHALADLVDDAVRWSA